ncbi:hypothetical protein GCM10011492_18710 [Flexivirga endophytica]|uniref:Uncharacterized protein n=1 Tax=Flexivirga endophytica TaxID=1849103 RepID=A0A916WTN0_9MICO|nr:hypothetical protein [Flexivirga endophytica]GGB28699.1 hypothetical protein GCM10011492_18710 [Flexivirga endophytica]GHB62374.1 hypothetical protein GCM10008112_34400 [Flexivirga endophytica]
MASSKQTTALNLASAAAAGAMTLIRPARFPKWARRGLRWANTAGTAGSLFLVVQGDDLPDDHPLHKALSASDVMAAASGGLMLVTSGLGMKADDKVEAFLVKHGVKHPRVVMAVGVVVVMFAVKTVQDRSSKKAPTAGKPSSSQPGSSKPAGTKPSATTKPANPALPSSNGATPPVAGPAASTDGTDGTAQDGRPEATR